MKNLKNLFLAIKKLKCFDLVVENNVIYIGKNEQISDNFSNEGLFPEGSYINTRSVVKMTNKLINDIISYEVKQRGFTLDNNDNNYFMLAFKGINYKLGLGLETYSKDDIFNLGGLNYNSQVVDYCIRTFNKNQMEGTPTPELIQSYGEQANLVNQRIRKHIKGNYNLLCTIESEEIQAPKYVINFFKAQLKKFKEV